jgi:hypothetical protein
MWLLMKTPTYERETKKARRAPSSVWRKRTPEDLNGSEEQLRVLVKGVKDYAIFTLDPAGNVR